MNFIFYFSGLEAVQAGIVGEDPSDVTRAGFIFLPFPLYPDDYPRQSADLVALATKAGPAALAVLRSLLKPGQSNYVVFAFKHSEQITLVGLTLLVGTMMPGNQRRLPIWHGYRQHKIPEDELTRRISSARLPLVRTRVDLASSTALLRRTTGKSADALSNASVAILGCGALGSEVAQLLAKSGIRNLTLIDNESLTWQNVGRHVLAGSDVGLNKAEAMRMAILDRFPGYNVDAIARRWQDEWQLNPKLFEKHDLILSLTGNWTSDCRLNDLFADPHHIPPIIFGWVEAHALAGHALLVLPEGGCLRCSCDKVGQFKHAVATVPPEHRLQRESSCGSFFQTFSAAAVSPVASMIAKMTTNAIAGKIGKSEHRAWVGAKDEFDAVDATITPRWASELEAGGWERLYRMPLNQAPGCALCGSK